MPGIARDVILEPRLGSRKSARVYRFTIGTEVVVWLDVRDDMTGALVPGAANVSALSWQPNTRDNEAAAQALAPVEATPGIWQVQVPTPVPGTYTVFWAAEGQAAEISFDVSTAGTLVAPGVDPRLWGDIEAVAAAASRGALLPEALRLIQAYAGPVVNEAIAAAMQGIGDAAAEAATGAMAERLNDLATKATVAELDRRVGDKASKGSLAELERKLADKADTTAVRQTTDALGQRIDQLAEAGPGPAQVTPMAIAKAYGAPVPDFADGRNAYRLFFM